LLVTTLLVIGTRESATVNAVLVAIKIAALTLFSFLAIPVMNMDNFEPFSPNGFLGEISGMGIAGAAASIFFAYVGFDAVSTAAEETKNPQRNMPIGLIGSLLICTVFYLVVSGGAVGSIGAQPVVDPVTHQAFEPASAGLMEACRQPENDSKLVCSGEPLAHVLDQIGWKKVSQLIGLAAFLALPSVILMMLFGQTRIFFAMARDGLVPESWADVNPRTGTPAKLTIGFGIFAALIAALVPLGAIVEMVNIGTLFAFILVNIGVMVLRRTRPDMERPFKVPFPYIWCPIGIALCIYLITGLPLATYIRFVGWLVVGVIIYLAYGYSHSRLRHHYRGVPDLPEIEADAPPPEAGTR
jgi:APA family basic amino acid/polyamine antiporter